MYKGIKVIGYYGMRELGCESMRVVGYNGIKVFFTAWLSHHLCDYSCTSNPCVKSH